MATSTDQKPDSKSGLTNFTVVVHTAILLSYDKVKDKTTDRVLTGGQSLDLDPEDEYVARLVDLGALRPTAVVEKQRAARQKVLEAQAELRQAMVDAQKPDAGLAQARAEADAPELQPNPVL